MSVSAVVEAIEHAREMFEYPYNLVRIEAYNRYIVIDPIIRALGWKTENPDECMVEWPRGKKRVRWVDYAFFLDRHADHPVMIIEAKGMGKVATRPETQISKYIKGRKPSVLKRGVVTDGNALHIYNLQAAESWAKKHIETVKISEGSTRQNAKLLNDLLSKQALIRLFD